MKGWLREVYTDWSTISLILSNILVAFLAILNDWSLLTLIWAFLIQGIIILTFKTIPIIEYYRIHKNSKLTKSIPFKDFRGLIIGFLLCTAAFIYPLYILSLNASSPHIGTDPIYAKMFNQPPVVRDILIGSIIFLINHIFSYIYNIKKYRELLANKPEEYTISTFKALFARQFIPMLFAICLGYGTSLATMIAFLSFKMVCDVVGHIWMLRITQNVKDATVA